MASRRQKNKEAHHLHSGTPAAAFSRTFWSLDRETLRRASSALTAAHLPSSNWPCVAVFVLTQSSLTDVGPGGSRHDELRVRGQLLRRKHSTHQPTDWASCRSHLFTSSDLSLIGPLTWCKGVSGVWVQVGSQSVRKKHTFTECFTHEKIKINKQIRLKTGYKPTQWETRQTTQPTNYKV